MHSFSSIISHLEIQFFEIGDCYLITLS